MAGEYLDPSNWYTWMDSAMAGPVQQPMTDINTPRLRRTQENRRSDWPADETNPYMLETAMMHPTVAGTVGAAVRGMTMFPKVGAGLLASYYGLSGTDPAGGQEGDAAVRQLQTQLRDAGLYSGAIDGKIGRETKAAQQQFMQQQQLQLQQQQLQIQQQGLQTQNKTSDAQMAETARLQEAERIANEQREEGLRRFREAEKSVGPVSRWLRDYGTPTGATLGILGGPLARLAVTKTSNALSRGTASSAESLMEKAGKGAVPGRVANVNEFWRQGGQSSAVPFISTPGQMPGFAVNPAAAGMDKLFLPNKVGNAATDLGVTAGFGAEYGGSKYMQGGAEEELRAAEEAFKKDPSDVNINRIQKATDKVAFYDAASNLGRVGAVTYPAAMWKMQRAPTVPSMAAVEAEKLKLEELLRKKSLLGQLAPAQLPARNSFGIPPAAMGPSAWMARQLRQP